MAQALSWPLKKCQFFGSWELCFSPKGCWLCSIYERTRRRLLFLLHIYSIIAFSVSPSSGLCGWENHITTSHADIKYWGNMLKVCYLKHIPIYWSSLKLHMKKYQGLNNPTSYLLFPFCLLFSRTPWRCKSILIAVLKPQILENNLEIFFFFFLFQQYFQLPDSITPTHLTFWSPDKYLCSTAMPIYPKKKYGFCEEIFAQLVSKD